MHDWESLSHVRWDCNCVSTVGLDEEKVREYIREQETLESGQGDLDLK